MIIIHPYKMYSKGAKDLKQIIASNSFPIKRVKPNGKYTPNKNDLVINWGNREKPKWDISIPKLILNNYDKVSIAVNKLKTFEKLKEKEVPIPRFTESLEEALSWKTHLIFRKMLESRSGKGAIFIDIENDSYEEKLPGTKLFVEYIKKYYEYRVHVFNNKIIDIQQKRKRKGAEADYRIRSHSNGWVFTREDIFFPIKVEDAAKAAIKALELDFGAVDVIYNKKRQQAYVLEVNTAPGLVGTTLTKYSEAIIEYYRNMEA